MAIVTTAKYTGGGGSTPGNRVVLNISGANHSLSDSDFTFGGKVTNVNMIETVMNCGASAVTIDGKLYETGRWELSQIGGIPLAELTHVLLFLIQQVQVMCLLNLGAKHETY